jgi:hypothetical protein
MLKQDADLVVAQQPELDAEQQIELVNMARRWTDADRDVHDAVYVARETARGDTPAAIDLGRQLRATASGTGWDSGDMRAPKGWRVIAGVGKPLTRSLPVRVPSGRAFAARAPRSRRVKSAGASRASPGRPRSSADNDPALAGGVGGLLAQHTRIVRCGR